LSALYKAAKSWKTTLVGILAGLALVVPQLLAVLDGNPDTVFSVEVFMSGLATMGIGTLAKDGDKSSEELGL
jgi:hypothetical protein